MKKLMLVTVALLFACLAYACFSHVGETIAQYVYTASDAVKTFTFVLAVWVSGASSGYTLFRK